MLKMLCQKFVERATTLGLKGKRRDDEMIAYMIGAGQALKLIDHDQADHVLTVTAMVLASRGYRECERIASDG